MKSYLGLACLRWSIECDLFQFQVIRISDLFNLTCRGPLDQVIFLPFINVGLVRDQIPSVKDRALHLVMPSLIFRDEYIEEGIFIVFFLLVLSFLSFFLVLLDF